MSDRSAHWEQVYASKPDVALSWLQGDPALSLALVDALPSVPRSAMDVGGGQSRLAVDLLVRGVTEVTVLDLSAAALQRAGERLGDRAGLVRWLQGDATTVAGLPKVELWHDRACFHFLTEATDRDAYVQRASETVLAGGHAIIASFALDGPERCSGLPIQRWSVDGLRHAFSAAFDLTNSATEIHTTPWGASQSFVYAVLRRRP